MFHTRFSRLAGRVRVSRATSFRVVGFLLTALAAALGGRAQVVYTPTFTASNLSMWGGGSATTIDFSNSYGVSWDASGSVGGITSTPIGDFGARVYGSTSGYVGLDVGFKSNSGSVNINLPYKVTVTPSATNMDAAGTYTLAISSQLDLQPGQSVVTTTFPNAQFTLGGELRAKMTIGGEIAAFKRVGGSTTLFDFDAGKFPILSYNQDNNKKLSVFGSELAELSKKGITIALPPGNELPDSGTAMHQSIFSGLPVGVTLGTLTLVPPQSTLDGHSGSGMTASGSQPTFVSAKLDILGVASALAGLPVNPLDLRADILGLSINAKIFSARVGLDAGLAQDVTLNQSLGMKLRSSDYVTYLLPNGTSVTTREFILTDPNTTITIQKNQGAVAIYPEFFLIDPQLRNQLDLTLGVGFSLEALKLTASKGLSSYTLGPVFPYDHVLPIGSIDVYDQTFNISQLGYKIFGGSLTNVQPTVGNIAAGEYVQFYGRSGLFSTETIDGALELKDGAAYQNTSNLTIGATGTLAVQAGTTPETSNTFNTSGLTNNGLLSIGAGSTVELGGGAASFTNLVDGTLTGGTYVIGGTLRVPNAVLHTNAANLYLAGGTLDTVSNGDALPGLTTNATTGLLHVAQTFTFTNAFTNAGSFIADGPVVTAPDFTNASTGTASVLSGTLRVGVIGNAGVLTNNGVLNVLGGDLQLYGTLGNLNNTTGTLSGGGTWNIARTLTYGGLSMGLPDITTLASGTTINLFHGGAIYNNFNPFAGTADTNTGLNGLTTNAGTLRIIGGDLRLKHGLTNTGTILVTPDGAGDEGFLAFSGSLDNSNGTLQVDAGARLQAYNTETSYVPQTWTNVSAGGVLSGIGHLTLGGTLQYSGAKITSLVGDLTLSGDAWQFKRLVNPGTGMDVFDNGLALTSVQGALRLTNEAAFTTPAASTFTLTNGTLQVGTGSTFTVDHGMLKLNTGAAITNDGVIQLNHSGTTPARLDVAADTTLAGAGSLQLSNFASNEILSTGGTLTNSSLHVIAGAGVISAPIVNQGTIQSLGSAGLTITGPVSNSGLLLAHGTATADENFDTYTYTPGPLTLSGTTVTNTATGLLAAASTLNVNNTTISGGKLETLSSGTINFGGANATLTNVSVTNAEGGTITIAPGTTAAIGGSGTFSFTNAAGAVFEIGGAGSLALASSTPFVNRGTILLGDTSRIRDWTADTSAVVQNYGTIAFAAPNTSAAINTDLVNAATGVMNYSDGNTLTLRGGTFTNQGTVLLGNDGTTGALAFESATDLTGGGIIALGGLVKTTTNGVDSYHWENSGVLRGSGSLKNLNNTIAGAGRIGDGNLTIINGADGTIRASASGGTLTINAGAGDPFFGQTGFTNQGLLKVDPGATMKIITGSGSFNNVQAGDLSGGRYEIAGTFQFDTLNPITVNHADLTLLGQGRITDYFNNPALALTSNYGTLRLQGGASAILGGGFGNHGTVVLGGAGDLAGGSLTIAGLNFGGPGTTFLLADSTAQLILKGRPDAEYQGAISGPGSVEMSGGGVQIFSGENTYSGGTSIVSGTLIVAHDGALGSGVVSLSSGTLASEIPSGVTLANDVVLTPATSSTLRAGLAGSPNSGALTLTGDISGTGGFRKTGRGTLTLSGDNSYAGLTQIEEGTLVAASDSALGIGWVDFNSGTLAGDNAARTIANNISLASDAAATITTPASLTLTGWIRDGSASASLQKTGAGTLTLTGSNTFLGTFTLSDGTLVIGHDYALGQSTLSLAGGTLGSNAARTLGNRVNLSGSATIDSANDLTFSGQVYGGGSLTKAGTGTLTLSGTQNQQSGSLRLAAGTLAIGTDNALGSSTLTFAGGTLASSGRYAIDNTVVLETNGTIGGPSDLALNGTISGGSKALTKTGSGTLALGGNNTFSGGTQVVGGFVEFSTLANLGSGNVTLNGGGLRWAAGSTTDVSARLYALGTSGATFDTNGNDVTFASALSGATLTKTGAGILALTAANTYTGGTTITGGLVEFATLANLGPGNVTLDGGGLRWATGASVDVSPRLNPLGTGGGTFDTNSNNVTFGTAISGGGGLTKAGAGALTLAANNTYTGGTTLAGGTLIVSTNTQLGDAAGGLTFDGGTLQAAANLSLVRTTTLASGGGSIDSNGHDLTFSGTIGGAGSLTKTGAGSLTLAGTNTYLGGTSLQGGTLVVGADANLGGSTAGLTFGGGTLQASAGFATARTVALATGGGSVDTNGHDLAFSGTISGASAAGLTKAGAGALTLSGNNTYAGNTTLSAGTLVVGHNHALGSGTLVLDGGTLQADATPRTLANAVALNANSSVAGAGALTLSGVVSGSKALTKNGAGTLTLAGNNTFAGGTKLNAGTLVIADDHALGSGKLTIAGGTVASSGSPFVDNLIELLANIVFDIDPDLTLSNTLSSPSGAYGFRKTGSGTLTLTAANTYTGETIVDSGTLVAVHNQAFGAGTLVLDGGTVQAAGTARLLNNAVQLAASSAIGGDLNLTFAGTLTNTFAGNPTLAVTNTGTTTFAGNVNLSNSATNRIVTLDNAGAVFIGGVIADGGTSTASGLAKTGAGALTLSANNTYRGATTLSGGSLIVDSDAALGTGTLVLAGGTLQSGSAAHTIANTVSLTASSTVSVINDLTLSGVISSSAPATLTKTGGGKLTLSGSNTYVGTTALNAGTLVVAADAALGTSRLVLSGGKLEAAGGTRSLANAVTLAADSEIGGADHLALSGAISGGAFNLTKVDANTLVLYGDNTYSGATVIQSGTLVAASDHAFGTSTVVLAGGTLQAGNGDRILDNAVQLAATTTTIGGSQKLTFNAALTNTVAGYATLTVTNTDATTFAGGVNLSNSATSRTLTLDNANAVTISGAIANGGTSTASGLVKTGEGTLTLSGDNTYGGSTLLAGGLVVIGSDTAFGTGEVVLNGSMLRSAGGPHTLANDFLLHTTGSIDTATDLTLGGRIVSLLGLAKYGAGRLTLTGFNNYAGDTSVSEGTLAVGSSFALGQGRLILRGGNLDAAGSPQSIGNAVILENEAGIGGGADLTLTGVISGTSSAATLRKVGDSTLTLAAANTYAGDTRVEAGTLVAASDHAFSSGKLILAGGAILGDDNPRTLDNAVEFTGASVSLGSSSDLTFTHEAINKSGGDLTLTFTNTGTTSFSGAVLSDSAVSHTLTVDGAGAAVITGAIVNGGTSTAGALVKAGAGRLTLSGANTFGGGTTLQGGTLIVGNDAALGPGTFTLAGGTLQGDGSAHTLGNTVALTGNAAIGGASDLTFAGTLTNAGGSHTLAITNSGVTTFTGAVQLSDSATARTLTLQGETAASFSGVISDGPGAGSRLAKTGAGTLVLSATNTYTGGTEITGGLIEFAAPENFGTGRITLDGGGLRWATGNNTDLSSRLAPIGTGGATLDGNGNTVTLAANLTAAAGANASEAWLTIAGAGSVALTGTGGQHGTIVSGGATFAVASDASLGVTGAPLYLGGVLQPLADFSSNRAVTAIGGGFDTSTGRTLTWNGDIRGANSSGGQLVKAGDGTLVLNGTNDLASLAIHGGTLRLGANGSVPSLSSMTIDTGAKFDANGHYVTLTGAFAGGGVFDLGTAGATLNTDYNALYLDGTFAGSGTLTTQGIFSLIVRSGAIRAPLDIVSGWVEVGDNSLSASNPVHIGAAGTLWTKYHPVTIGGLSGNGVVQMAETGFLGQLTIAQNLDTSFDGLIGGYGDLIKSGTGTLTLASNQPFKGNTTINGGKLSIAAQSALGSSSGRLTLDGGTLRTTASFSLQRPLTIGTSGGTFETAAGTTLTINSQNSGSGNLVKTGSGKLYVQSSLNVGGDLVVNAGTLQLFAPSGFGGSQLAGSNVSVAAGATLAGSSRFSGTLMLGGTLAPGGSFNGGNAPGTLSTGSETWLGGGTFRWELRNALGTAGGSTGWDLANITGNLTLLGTSLTPFRIELVSLATGNLPGLAANFDPTQNYSFTLATTTTGIFGFNTNAFVFDLDEFANPLSGGRWSVAQVGNKLNLEFTVASAIPEPSTYAALFGACALVFALARRHRHT